MKLDSITLRILFALIGTTVVCLGSYFSYNYLNLERDYFHQLQNERQVAGRQAKKNLAIPLYNFDNVQAMQVIEGLMINPNIQAITIRDHFLPNSSFLSFKRGPDGNLVAATEPTASSPFLDTHTIDHHGSQIGSVDILFTDEYIRASMRQTLLSKLTALVSLTIILSFTIFFILRQTVILPLRRLETLALGIDQDGNSATPFNAEPFAKEIRHVYRAMVETQDQLHARIKELSQSQQALKHSEKMLQQAQKMEAIGRLAGGIAHDFNNVLSGILGYTEIMLLNEPSNTTRYTQLQQVLSGGKRARDLVKQILAFSHNSQAEKRPFHIGELLDEALNLLRISIPVVIDIKYQIDADCGLVYADSSQFHQVLMNIFTNASHAMEKSGGVLSIRMKPVDSLPERLQDSRLDPKRSYAEILISDTGTGIDESVIDRIFDPFFTTKEKGKGTGMGLSVVYGIVKDMEGAILVDSKPGQGTTFSIYLPVMKSAASEFVAAAEELESPKEGTIMVVDDEEMVVGVLRVMLEQMGYTIRSFTRSFDALQEFQANPDDYDLIITDYAMPGINGIELVDRCIEKKPTIPILLCTGFSDKIDDKLAKARGVQAFVYKPVDRSDLSRIVTSLIN